MRVINSTRRFFYNLTSGPGIINGLTGKFDIEGASIVGTVRRIPYSPNYDLSVEAIRDGAIIVSCVPGKARDDRNAPFVLPMLGFDASDLILERVVIRAQTSRGDTGMMQLDRATHAELTRIYLGPKTESMIEIDFSVAGHGHNYLGKGWSRPYGGSTCTEDYDSFISFSRPDPAYVYFLRMRYSAFVWPTLLSQRVEIFVNENNVASFVSRGGGEFHNVEIDREFFAPSLMTVLRIHHPDAEPHHVHAKTQDKRILAVNFRRLSLVRVVGGVSDLEKNN